MDTQTWTEWIRLRTSDIRAIFPTYIAFTFGILTLLTFGHEHLENMQWQTTVIVVIANFWWLLFMDGAIADVAAGAKDMDDDIAQSEMGKLYAKAPVHVLSRGFRGWHNRLHHRRARCSLPLGD